MVQDAEAYERELDLNVRQRMKEHEFFVGWHNLSIFAVRSAKVYAVVCVCSYVLEQNWEFALIACAVAALFGVLHLCAVWQRWLQYTAGLTVGGLGILWTDGRFILSNYS